MKKIGKFSWIAQSRGSDGTALVHSIFRTKKSERFLHSVEFLLRGVTASPSA